MKHRPCMSCHLQGTRMACTWRHARCERQLLAHLMSSRGMNFLTSMTGRIYCAAWQPLTSAKQESGSANPSEVTLEGDSRSKRRALWQRACSEALLQPGRGDAQEGQLGMQRRRRSCHRLCQLSHCRPHEEAKQSAAGPAIEGVAEAMRPFGDRIKMTVPMFANANGEWLSSTEIASSVWSLDRT